LNGKRTMKQKEERAIKLAESWLERAWHKLDEAKEHLKLSHYAESISSSQECIELSIKVVFLLLRGEYPKRHEFKEEEFEAILNKVPEKLEYLEFPKLYLYSKFWSNFYTVTKYGLEKMGVGANKLFEKEEAELALRHAERCKSAANQLESYVKHPQ